jgi:4-hydroxybenzoate polyprenyltransferase
MQHKGYHVFLFISGLLISLYFFYYISNHWLWIGLGAFLTFLYSAPKIPMWPFQLLKKVAYGKTIFLSFVWTYVTIILPMIIENAVWSEKSILFCLARFFFIYAICIIFDYRDREDDKADGIKSLIIYMSDKSVNILFVISILFSVCLYLLLTNEGISFSIFLILAAPAFIVAFLFNHAKKNYSDYLYYFVLDGLMMLSGLVLLLMSWF